MSQFEREDMDVIAMVNAHNRRQNITRQVGYIVTQEEAQELAVAKARERNGDGIGSILLFVAALMTIAVTTASILGGVC